MKLPLGHPLSGFCTASKMGLISLLMPLMALLGTAGANCPDRCLCILNTQPYQVLCEQAGLHNIPSDLPPQTEHLSLRKNNINAIPADAFRRMRNLKRLVLDSNHIRDISPYAFRGLANLEELSVQDNLITFLATNSFANLTNITNLLIGFNKIEVIEMNTFCNTRNIRSLSLTGNPLRTIHSGAFAGLHNVEILYLPNGIEVLESDTFNGLSNVSMLRLAHMRLNTLPQYAFRGLINVSSLTIRESNITHIKSRAFYGLINVKYLTLENNNIEIFETNALQGVHSIQVLAIHHNRIRTLEPLAFGETADHVHKTRFVNNSFACDCRLRWVAETHAHFLPGLLSDNFCLEPPHVANRNASLVHSESLMPCTTHPPPVLEPDRGPVEAEDVHTDIEDEDDIFLHLPDEPEAQPSGEMLNTSDNAANAVSSLIVPPLSSLLATLILLSLATCIS